MWYRIFLLISMCVFTSCANKMLSTEYYNMKLTISTTTDTVFDTTNIAVSFENNTTNDIYLLNRGVVAVSDNQAYLWRLEVLFQDTILMMSPINFLSKIKRPTKEDYFLLKSGDKYTFNFDVDFSKLVQKPYEFGNLNDDYGEYTLKLTYADPFLANKKAFRGIIESNEIRLLYKKNSNNH